LDWGALGAGRSARALLCDRGREEAFGRPCGAGLAAALFRDRCVCSCGAWHCILLLLLLLALRDAAGAVEIVGCERRW
jgi:hypothetical protein